MLVANNSKANILAVFNRCSETTIPLENFIHINAEEFNRNILSFYQDVDEIQKVLCNSYLNGIILHGLNDERINTIKPFKLTALLRNIKPDVIHVHHSISGLLASVIGSIFTKAKIVATLHSDFRFYNRRQKVAFVLTYFLSDLVICNSQNTRNSIEDLIKRFGLKAKTKVIYNGVDIDELLMLKKETPDRTDKTNIFRIGTIGRMVSAKDHKTLIEAFASFNLKFPDSSLTLIGDGPLRKNLMHLADELGIREKVAFCGLLPRERVYEKLSSFDLFVVSSKWEGFCNAMVEAMLAEVPIIASDIEPLPEVLGRDNGTFFRMGNVEDLCKKMIHCHCRYEEIKNLAKKAYDRAYQRYSLKQSVSDYESVYRSIICS